jgi:hypothetical protein
MESIAIFAPLFCSTLSEYKYLGDFNMGNLASKYERLCSLAAHQYRSKEKPKPQIHRYLCQEFDPIDNYAYMTDLTLLEQGQVVMVEAYCDDELSQGQIYRGFIDNSVFRLSVLL